MLEQLIEKGEAARGDFMRKVGRFGFAGPFGALFAPETRARRGDLKFAILEVLNEKPRHGYDVIRELEERNSGLYRPSAGAVYPTLQMLEEGGFLASEQVDDKKIYTVTDEGRTLLEGREPQPASSDNSFESVLEVKDSTMKLAAALMQAFRLPDSKTAAQAKKIIDQARRDIYLLLADEQN